MRILLIVALLAQFQLQAQSISDSLTNELQEFIANSSIKGLAVGIVDRDKPLYANGFGYANEADKLPYTTRTLQPIASISKTLLGVSLLKAQEQGLLSLDDPINAYLPFEIDNPNLKNEQITIRHLATHTSSLKDTKYYEKSYLFDEDIALTGSMPFDRYAKSYNENTAMELTDFLANIYTADGEWYSKKNFLKSDPGERYKYSNNGAALAALIIESASKMSYIDYVQANILDPLDMDESGWSLADYDPADKASLYAFGQQIPEFRLITFADGGFITNVKEFSNYFIAIINGYNGEDNELLSGASYTEMMSKQVNESFETGIFWVVGNKRIGHTGGDPGVTTVAYFKPGTNVGIIIFSNTSDEDIGKSIGDAFRIVDKYADRME